MPYTTEQRNWLLKEYEKTNSADAVRANWTAKYATAAPSRKTIYRIRHKFDATGSVLNKKSTGRPKSVTTDENKELVAQAVADIPGISSRQASLELDISQTSVVRIMKSLKWKPYRPQLVQDLLAGDPDRRLEFCSNFLNEVEENPGGEAESERKLPWVFVGNLTEEISEQELRAMFSRFGEIIQIFLNLGFASVQMATQEGAARAVRHLDGYEVYKKKITVKLASDEKYVNINTSTTSIKIDNLSPMVTNERLKEALSIFGEVERAVVIVNHQGKSTTRGIVEFSSELAAQNAVKQIEENIFLVSTSPRPISARIMEQEDSIYGLSEEKIIKTTEYYEETMKAPRFAVAGSFEQQIGQTWKIRYQLERQQRDQVEENIARSRKIFEEQLITCFTKQQAAMKIKQEVLSYDEQRAVDQCKKELEATNQIGMQTQQLVETSQINTDESPSDLIILPPSTSHNNFNETNNQVALITNPTTSGIGHKRSIESNHEDKEPHEKRRREMNEEEIGETSVPCETSSSVALWESQMVVNNNGQVVQSSRVTDDHLTDFSDGLEFTKTEKGKDKACLRGYYYNCEKRSKKDPTLTFFLCEEYSKTRCMSRMHVKDGMVTKQPTQHNHPPNEGRKLALMAREKLKVLATTTCDVPNEIISLATQGLDGSIQLPRDDTLKRTIQYTRQKQWQKKQ